MKTEKEIKEWDALRQYMRFGKIGKLHNLLLEEQIEKERHSELGTTNKRVNEK